MEKDTYSYAITKLKSCAGETELAQRGKTKAVYFGKKNKFKNYDLCKLISNKKVLSQGESLNSSENTASRVCNACDNSGPVVPSPKV